MIQEDCETLCTNELSTVIQPNPLKVTETKQTRSTEERLKRLQEKLDRLSVENAMYERYMIKLKISRFASGFTSSLSTEPSSRQRIQSRGFLRSMGGPDVSGNKHHLLALEHKCEIAKVEQQDFEKEMANSKEQSIAAVDNLSMDLDNMKLFLSLIESEKRSFLKSVVSVVNDPTSYRDTKSQVFMTFHRNYLRRLDHLVCRVQRETAQCRAKKEKLSERLEAAMAAADTLKPIDMELLRLRFRQRQTQWYELHLECASTQALSNRCIYRHNLLTEKLNKALRESDELTKSIAATKGIIQQMEMRINHTDKEVKSQLSNYNYMKAHAPAESVARKMWRSHVESEKLSKLLRHSQRQKSLAKLRLREHKHLWSTIRKSSTM